MKNVSTADKVTPSSTHLVNALTKTFVSNVLQWFDSTNACRITPPTAEILFGVLSNSHDKKTTGKFNYTILFMRHYLYSNKLNGKSISLKEFVQEVEHKYLLESIK